MVESKQILTIFTIFSLAFGLVLLCSSMSTVQSSGLVIEHAFIDGTIFEIADNKVIECNIPFLSASNAKIAVSFKNDNFIHPTEVTFAQKDSHMPAEEEFAASRNFITLDGHYLKYDPKNSKTPALPGLANLYFYFDQPTNNQSEFAADNWSDALEQPSFSQTESFSLLSELVDTRQEMTARLQTEDFEDDEVAAERGKVERYIVKSGENLLSISKKLDISYGTLKKINQLDSPFLDKGKIISVPDRDKMENSANSRAIRKYSQKVKQSRGGMAWPVMARRISSRFGYRIHPISRRKKFHNGIDLAANYGKQIISSATGIVEYAGWKSYYGKTVILRHPGGYKTLYAHCSKLFVKEGQKVKTGQQIASVGQSGLSTGPHLHFSVIRNGKYLNPIQYLK